MFKKIRLCGYLYLTYPWTQCYRYLLKTEFFSSSRFSYGNKQVYPKVRALGSFRQECNHNRSRGMSIKVCRPRRVEDSPIAFGSQELTTLQVLEMVISRARYGGVMQQQRRLLMPWRQSVPRRRARASFGREFVYARRVFNLKLTQHEPTYFS